MDAARAANLTRHLVLTAAGPVPRLAFQPGQPSPGAYRAHDTMSNSIKPSIGRKVWFWDHSSTTTRYGDNQAMDATIIYVWSDTCVNLAVTDHAGMQYTRTSVPLRDHREGDKHGVEYVATWMPYQVGQARAQSIGAAGPVTGG